MTSTDPQQPAKPYRPAERFLAPGAAHGDGLGYRNRPTREPPLHEQVSPETLQRIRDATSVNDEPQSLDRDDWNRHIDKRAKQAEEQRQKFESASREQARRLLSFEQRLVSAHEEAQRRCIDVSSEVRLVRHMQGKGKNVRHLEQRLYTIERKVWKDAA